MNKTLYLLIKETNKTIEGIELVNLNAEPFMDRARYLVIRPYWVEKETESKYPEFEQKGWLGHVYRKRDDIKTLEVTFMGNSVENIKQQLKSHEIAKRVYPAVKFRQRGTRQNYTGDDMPPGVKLV